MNRNLKNVIVTGASRGIGSEISATLLRQGYRVIGCSRNESAELRDLCHDSGNNFAWFPCEIGNEASESEFMKHAALDIGEGYFWGLVNNAGMAGEGVLATFPNVESRRLLEVNLLGPLRLTRAFLRHMLAQSDGGRIINISSILGVRGYAGLTAYSASKAGLDAFTRSLAREVGRRKITVNSVAPGYIETELSRSLSQEQRGQIIRRTPLGCLAETRDIACLVKFLMGDEARYITGQTIVVDGGISC